MPDYSSLDLPKIVYREPTPYEVYLEYGSNNYDFVTRQLYRNYLRTVLSERQNHKCCYCGTRVNDVPNSRRQSTLEHVIPQSRGGKWDLWNCVVACSKCNRKRSNNESAEEKMVILGLTNSQQFVTPYLADESEGATMRARKLGREAYSVGKEEKDNPYLPYSVPGLNWAIAFVLADLHRPKESDKKALTQVKPAAI